jgi:hypothetical protein
MPAIAQLGGDEQLMARHAGPPDRFAHAFFVLVALGRVDGAVPHPDGIGNHARRDLGVDLPDASPNCGMELPSRSLMDGTAAIYCLRS